LLNHVCFTGVVSALWSPSTQLSVMHMLIEPWLDQLLACCS